MSPVTLVSPLSVILPRTPWAWMFASCSANVVAKYVTPSLPVT